MLKAPIPSEAPAAAEHSRLQRAVLSSVATDPGLHPLAPYFAKLIADEVSANLKSVPTLQTLLGLVRALMGNPHVQLAPYVHQLLPPAEQHKLVLQPHGCPQGGVQKPGC